MNLQNNQTCIFRKGDEKKSWKESIIGSLKISYEWTYSHKKNNTNSTSLSDYVYDLERLRSIKVKKFFVRGYIMRQNII